MSCHEPRTESPRATGAAFATTLWSVVLAAGGDGAAAGERPALERLFNIYWRPLYAFLRRQGHSPHDAEDLTQGFILHVMERSALAQVRKEKGRFRSFLLAALKNFVLDQRDTARAVKRGGGQPVVSLDGNEEEGRYLAELADRLDPSMLFERRWAMALIDQAMSRLAADYSARGKADLYREIHGFLLDKKNGDSYAQVGVRLGLAESSVGVEVHRLREKFREFCRREIADTVPALDQIDDEMRQLFQALRA